MRPGDVRQCRVTGDLLLILGEELRLAAWLTLDLETGEQWFLSQAWLLRNTREWEFYA